MSLAWQSRGSFRRPCRGRCPHRPTFLNPFFSFSCQKEKNGFKLPRKERGQSANRCPGFDSNDLRLKLSVAFSSTTRKVSALCASPFGGATQQDQRLRADRVVRPYTQENLRAAPHDSASRSGERFFVKSRFEKRRNTLCIASVSNRRIGGKDPPKRADAIVRCCPQ